MAWSAPWERDMDSGGLGSTYEQLWVDAPAGSIMVEVDVPAVPGEQLRDNFLAAFANEVPLQQVDQGSYDDMTYSVDLIPYPGAPVGAFTLIREAPDSTMMVLLIASVDSFGEAIASAQTGVTVDGAALFLGVDGTVMQQRLATAAGGQNGTTQATTIETPTPHTGLNPDTPVAPTPAAGTVSPTQVVAGQVTTPTPATGGAVPVSPAVAQDVPDSGPVTLPESQITVDWSDAWSVQRISDSRMVLWAAEPRVIADIWTTSYTLPPESAAEFAESDLVASSGWSVESAVDLEPGRRFALTMSRNHGAATMYQYAEVSVLDTHLLVVSTSGWEGNLAAALPSVQASLTVNGQPGLTVAQQPSVLPQAQSPDGATHRLFDSALNVTWTPHWSEAVLQISGVRLIGPDEAAHYRIWDIVGGEPASAAEQAEGIISGAPDGSTLYKAIDIIPGTRAMVVLQQPVTEGVRYHIFDIYYVDNELRQGSTNQYITATDIGFGDQIATIQANVSLNGQPVFTDLETIVPELFAATAQASGPVNTQHTPTPQGVAQVTPASTAPEAAATVPVGPANFGDDTASSPVTIASNGWTIAWAEGWANEYLDEISTTLWSTTQRASFVVYNFDFTEASAAAFAQSEVEFLTGDDPTASWTIESATDVVPGSHYHVVFSRTTNGEKMYSVYDVVIENGIMTASILEAWDTEIMSALSSVQQTVTINGTPAMADVSLTLATPPASNDDFSYSLISSGRVVEWSGSWGTVTPYWDRLWLVGTVGEMPVFAALDFTLEQPDANSAEWVERYQVDNPGWTVYKAMDLNNGQRFVVVMRSADGTQYRFHDVDQSGPLSEELYLLVSSDAVAEQVAMAQANVTVDGVAVFGDIETLVPELFASATTAPQSQRVLGNAGWLSVA